MAVRKEDVIAWMSAMQRACAENRDRLTELDSAIGDADHGTNMDRGFTTAMAELDAGDQPDIRGVLQAVATSLIRHVGGTAGPLYGTFFLRASTECAGKSELEAPDIAAMFQAGIKGIQQIGKADPGDKTMLDALLPALTAMRKVLDDGGGLPALMAEAAEAAEAGMLGTIPLQARKGRASYLAARSIGHQDPGATSSYLLVKAAAEAFRT